MRSDQDAQWVAHFDVRSSATVPLAQRIAAIRHQPPDFHRRCAIRSVFDGGDRFSRCFSPEGLNTPTTWEALTTANDLKAVAGDGANRDLLMAMNAKLNGLIAGEVGLDDGSFLPLGNGSWVFPPASGR